MGEAGVHPISAVKVIRSTNKHVLYIYICMYVCNNISYGYVFVHVTYMYMYMYIIDYRYIDQIDDSRTELLHLPFVSWSRRQELEGTATAPTMVATVPALS